MYFRKYLLNCKKTKFHNSTTDDPLILTDAEASLEPWTSIWISEEGPHGPHSAISQKLCFNPNGNIRPGLTLEVRT